MTLLAGIRDCHLIFMRMDRLGMPSSRFFVNKSTFARSTIGVLLYQMVQEYVLNDIFLHHLMDQNPVHLKDMNKLFSVLAFSILVCLID